MSGKPSQKTEEEKEVDRELKKQETLPQYDTDMVEGEGWKKCFADILNTRFIDGWKYVYPIMRVGRNESKSPSPYIYLILYERIAKPVLFIPSGTINPENVKGWPPGKVSKQLCGDNEKSK